MALIMQPCMVDVPSISKRIERTERVPRWYRVSTRSIYILLQIIVWLAELLIRTSLYACWWHERPSCNILKLFLRKFVCWLAIWTNYDLLWRAPQLPIFTIILNTPYLSKNNGGHFWSTIRVIETMYSLLVRTHEPWLRLKSFLNFPRQFCFTEVTNFRRQNN